MVRIPALVLSASLFCGASACCAEDVVPVVYQRTSTHSMVQHSNWSHYGAGWSGGGWGFSGFYNPWFSPFTFAGTWYQRPYPDHLVFDNVRSHAVPLVPLTTECPCLETTE